MFFLLAACGSEPTGDDDDISACGDDVCNEVPSSCPEDCSEDVDAATGPRCGDAVCQAGETTATCPTDCPTLCGNGVCNTGEQSTCPNDCIVCGDGVCQGNEASTCASDCVTTARLVVRNQSSYSIWYLYLGVCGGSWSGDQLGANVINPGGQFTLSGIPPGCWYFRADTSAAVNRRWQTPSGVTLTAGQTYTWTLVN